MIVSPSLLSADFSNLAKDVAIVDKSKAEYIHVDVMDGVFVPNITFAFPVMKSVDKLSDKIMDVHLMIVEPQKFISEVKKCGGDIMTVHYEACTHLHRVIQQIKDADIKALGISLENHHRAVDDAGATAEIFVKCVEMLKEK